MSLISETLSRNQVFKKYHFDIFESVTKGGALKNINNSYYCIEILLKCMDKEKELFGLEFFDEQKHKSALQKYKRMIKKLESEDFVIELPLRKEILADKIQDNFTAYLNMTLNHYQLKNTFFSSEFLIQFLK